MNANTNTWSVDYTIPARTDENEGAETRALAAEVWAAAAGTAGAYAPRHIAAALEAEDDLMAAVMAGTAAAQREHDDACAGYDGGWPDPRGLDVHVQGGRATDLHWETETHLVALRVRRHRAETRWTVEVRYPDGAPSYRVLAAMREVGQLSGIVGAIDRAAERAEPLRYGDVLRFVLAAMARSIDDGDGQGYGGPLYERHLASRRAGYADYDVAGCRPRDLLAEVTPAEYDEAMSIVSAATVDMDGLPRDAVIAHLELMRPEPPAPPRDLPTARYRGAARMVD